MQFKLEDIIWPHTPFPVLDNALLIGNRGSVAHNTYVPSTDPNSIDDIDVMAIVVPPIKYYFGIDKWDMVEAINHQWDVVVYNFQKFISMLAKQNPNSLMMLWLEPEHYYHIHPLGQSLINHREMFSSRECFKMFVGYAQGQLKKMFHIAGRGYLGAKRKKLVEQYGVDIKNAAHVVRLLNMGIEFLETGRLNVKRTWDRDELVAIKTGQRDLAYINKLAADGFAKIEDAVKKSVLRPRIDRKAINDFCVKLTQQWFTNLHE